MRAGRIEQIGAPADLYDRPATLFVARFVGTPPMNAFEVGVDGRSPFGEATAGTTLGIRPEHLQLGGHGPWTATAVVAAVEHAGPEHHVHVQIGPVPAAVRTTDVPPPPGIEVLVSVDPAHVHVFDVDGRRTGTAAVPRQPITVS
jgi:ABC-type sugar transport system ATPase subunit